MSFTFVHTHLSDFHRISRSQIKVITKKLNDHNSNICQPIDFNLGRMAYQCTTSFSRHNWELHVCIGLFNQCLSYLGQTRNKSQIMHDFFTKEFTQQALKYSVTEFSWHAL